MGIHLFKRNGNSGNGNLRAGRNGNGNAPVVYEPPKDGGKLIVLTAPLTETIDHAGYFIQMALASMPKPMEAAIDQKYPKWREVERDQDGSARYMPAGVRLVEASLLREFPAEEVVCCYPDDLPRFVGPETLVIVSSYSGNTEETTTAHREAIKRKAKVICISSNGLTERMAKRGKSPLFKVPGGLPPRAALGYSFFPTLVALSRIGVIASKNREIRETVELLEKKAALFV